jgi:hypothetical protein
MSVQRNIQEENKMLFLMEETNILTDEEYNLLETILTPEMTTTQLYESKSNVSMITQNEPAGKSLTFAERRYLNKIQQAIVNAVNGRD